MDVEQLLSLYDAPPKVLRLVGGPHDGERVTVHLDDWPLRWLMAGPIHPLEEWLTEPEPVFGPASHPAYEYTDSVSDCGERTYRYLGDR